jgi:cyanate permease
MLLLGRVIEGIGLGLIAVIAPAAIALWFKPDRVGLPMGIWATWMPVGSAIAYNITTPIQASFGWQGVWWFGTALGLISFIVYALFVTCPPVTDKNKITAKKTYPEISFTQGLKTPAIWLLAIGLFGPTFGTIGYTTWSPVYFNEVFFIDAVKANFFTSVVYIVKIFGALSCGWVLSRVKDRNLVLIGASVLATIVYPIGFTLGSAGLILPYVILIGFVPAYVAATTFASAPTAVPSPALAGLAMAAVMVGQNSATLIAPPLMGAVIERTGSWAAAGIPMLVVMILSTAALLIYYRIKKLTTGSSYDKEKIENALLQKS